VIRDAHERGAKVSRRTDGQYLIDELPVILDAWLDIRDNSSSLSSLSSIGKYRLTTSSTNAYGT
jgi:hypothetical protein